MKGLPHLVLLSNKLLTWLLPMPIHAGIMVSCLATNYFCAGSWQLWYHPQVLQTVLWLEWGIILWNQPYVELEKWTVNLLMPNLIAKMLNKFQHSPTAHSQHLPCKHTSIKYGMQLVHSEDPAPLLLDAQWKYMPELDGTLLYIPVQLTQLWHVSSAMLPQDRCIEQQQCLMHAINYLITWLGICM